MINIPARGFAKVPVIFLGVLAFGMLGFIVYKSMTPAQPAATLLERTPKSESQDPKGVKDFAPDVPKEQKTTLVIRLADSSTVKYIVPLDQVDTYMKSLPQGARVVSTE